MFFLIRHNGWRYAVVIFYGFETLNINNMENLKALVYKGDLTPYQRSLAKREFEGLIERLELFEKAVKNNAVLPLVNGWLDFESNKELFNEEAKKNCLCKFEDGTIIRYDDEHPMEIMTHFKLAEACR